MDPFATLVQNLNALGFYDFLLPWLFVFAVVYGLLAKVKLFGDNNNNRISALIAFVAAFFAVGYAGVSLAGFFTGMFGGATLILTGILVIVLFLAMAGFNLANLTATDKKWGAKLAVLLIIVIGVVIFTVATGTVIGGVSLNQDALAAILIVIVILVAIWFVTKEGKPVPTGQPTG